MGKKTKTPKPPDPVKTAEAQGAVNKETAIAQAQLNMVDQSGPFGTLTYERIPGQTQRTFDQKAYDSAMKAWKRGPAPDRNSFYYDEEADTPRYRAVTQLSPQQQAILDKDTQLGIDMLDVGGEQLGRVANALGQPINFDGAPAMRTPSVDDFSADRQRVEQAMIERMQPYLDQQRDARRTQLVNQGFSDFGSEGYTRAMDEVARAENDARLAAIMQAGQEQSRLQGMDLAGMSAQNAARQQAIQEMMLERQTPINEISALMSGSQVQQPQFVNTPQTGIQPADLMGATYASYQGDLANAQMKQRQNQALMGGLFDLGGSGLGAFGATGGFGWF